MWEQWRGSYIYVRDTKYKESKVIHYPKRPLVWKNEDWLDKEMQLLWEKENEVFHILLTWSIAL